VPWDSQKLTIVMIVLVFKLGGNRRLFWKTQRSLEVSSGLGALAFQTVLVVGGVCREIASNGDLK